MGRPCAGCGRLIRSGLYCESCLEKFRDRAKVQGERMENLKSNALRRVAENRGEITILIINSDERNLSITRIVFERGLTECKILTANNPLIAINILLRREINLVVLDADYNGLEMLGRIRDDERFKGMPVMMMSSSTQRELVASVFALGVQDYVTKPCAPADLIGRVQKLLNLTEADEGAEPRPQKTTFSIVQIEYIIVD